MNKIDLLFKKKGQHIFSIYFPAGFPTINDTVKNLQLLSKRNIDMLEIGIPFSDPLADGPVIQHASQIALNNGMNLKLLFEQLKEFDNLKNIPLLLMGYWNTVFQFGVKNFVHECNKTSISGVIFPDLPIEEYIIHYKQLFEANNLYNIFLVSPNTSDDRLQKIALYAKGFIYVVSMSSITGGKMFVDALQEDYFNRISALGIPTMIGFGISDKEKFQHACRFANGGIIGTAFIRALWENRAGEFLNEML